MDAVTCIPQKKKEGTKTTKNERSSSSSNAFDQQHIFGPRCRTSYDPGEHMELHLYKHDEGGMCEQLQQKNFVLETWGGLG